MKYSYVQEHNRKCLAPNETRHKDPKHSGEASKKGPSWPAPPCFIQGPANCFWGSHEEGMIGTKCSARADPAFELLFFLLTHVEPPMP